MTRYRDKKTGEEVDLMGDAFDLHMGNRVLYADSVGQPRITQKYAFDSRFEPVEEKTHG